MLHVRKGAFRARVAFGLVCDLSVPVFLGTSFLPKFMSGIFPPERKIVPYKSTPVPILAFSDQPEDKDEKA